MIKTLISTTAVDYYVSHYEFVSVNNVLRKYGNMKGATKNLKTTIVHQKIWPIFKKCCIIAWSVQKI